MIGVGLLMVVLILIITAWYFEKSEHDKRLEQIRIRVQVNGIRGKSTVTRLGAGVLQEAGIRTVAKTTGSAARVILPNGEEIPLTRIGAPTVIEILNVVRQHTNEETEAVVFETMALQPNMQVAMQEVLIKGNYTVITNIREDHQDVMGETLEEIADTLSLTIPEGGTVITAEELPHIRERLRKNAEARGSKLVFADPNMVTDREMEGFSYLSFRENVAIGLVVAELLGIPRSTAMQGMYKARPDVGVVNLQHANWHGKKIIWAPLFAVNDRESTVISMDTLKHYYHADAVRIGILNNRYDRADRAMRFAQIAAEDLKFEHWITFGAYEEQVTARMVELGVPRDRIVNLGFSVNPSFETIKTTVASLVDGDVGVLVGLVNIHTPQAELLMDYFHDQPDAPIHSREDAWNHYHPGIETLKERMASRVSKNMDN
jgi:poly-gamma-glutamate synthase PgsB/CapB